MNTKVGKYEFDSLEQANSMIAGVENSLYHTFVKLGNIVLVQGEYDEDGNEVVAPTLSEKFSVDVLWYKLDCNPEGWSDFAIDILDEGVHVFSKEGVHGFSGISYQENKIQ